MTSLALRRPRATVLLIAGLALAGGLAGCSSSGGGSNSSASQPLAGPAKADQNKDAGAPPAAAGAGGGAAQAPGAPAAKPGQASLGQRSIVYTGAMTVRVDNVNGAADQLESIVAGLGGFVGGDQRQMDSGRSTATLTLRVPADKFTGLLDQIGHLPGAKEQSRQVSTQDVTGQVVDLAARIQAQQASVDRVRALLAKAQSIAEITSVESELSRRESDLESLQAQQRNLADLTALSTISVTLLGPDAIVPPPPPQKKPETGFLAGLKSGWHAFVASVQVVLTVVGALLPFAIVVGVPVLLVLWWARRRGRRPEGGQSGPVAQVSSVTTEPKAASEG